MNEFNKIRFGIYKEHTAQAGKLAQNPEECNEIDIIEINSREEFSELAAHELKKYFGTAGTAYAMKATRTTLRKMRRYVLAVLDGGEQRTRSTNDPALFLLFAHSVYGVSHYVESVFSRTHERYDSRGPFNLACEKIGIMPSDENFEEWERGF